MAEQAQPLTDEERAELEELRAEKAAREERARAARERAELEELRAQHAAAEAQTQADMQRVPTPAPAQVQRTRVPDEEDLRIAEARARGAKIMEPDDDLNMPLGRKIVLAVLALVVIIIVVMTKLLG